jgi:inorganic triphosphatase YgiF
MVDRGKIDSGDGSTPICELELELKRGDKGQLFEIARLLVHAAPIQVSLKSKAERGYEFIDGSKDLAIKANPVQLPIHGNARDSFRAIGFACLKQILDNRTHTRARICGPHQARYSFAKETASQTSQWHPFIFEGARK